MLSKDLTKLIGEAMKAHDEIRVSTLRLLLSAFNYEQIDKQHELSDEEELVVIRREAKKRKEAIEMYKKGNAPDRAQKEESELKILQKYLPPEMSEEELNHLIDESIKATGAVSIADMGRVIGYVKEHAPGVDGGKVAEIVRGKLK